MKKNIFLLLLPLLSIYANEPSAFGAGDLTVDNPYGLTSSEKVLLETKKNLHKVEIKSKSQASIVNSISERVDGLQSVVEAIGKKAHKNRLNLQKLSDKTDKSFLNTQEYEKRLSLSIENNRKSIEENTKEIQKLKIAISELSQIVDSINSKYLAQDEFNLLVQDFNRFKKSLAKELTKLKVVDKKSNSLCSNMSNGKVADKAKIYFNKKYYTKAVKCYKYLIKHSYKPAHSHYMIGEMMYRNKDYGGAVSYFKKSASLYSKASYMPKLMLHTAISMKKTRDYDNANMFFNAIISKYPNSKEAKEANRYLSK